MNIFLQDRMGNSTSAQKINFEDTQTAITTCDVVIINTIESNKQMCLIKNTLTPSDEISQINNWIKSPQTAPLIIIYGENSCDDSVSKKYMQLIGLGFKRIAIYSGGLFEWLLLQDIYGDELFPTQGETVDMLKYKGINKKHLLSLGYQN